MDASLYFTGGILFELIGNEKVGTFLICTPFAGDTGVRIRTYKTVGSTKFYSGWSAAKAVTIKK